MRKREANAGAPTLSLPASTGNASHTVPRILSPSRPSRPEQYYTVPWLSYRNAVWIDAELSRPWFPKGWESLSKDRVHPNDRGHK